MTAPPPSAAILKRPAPRGLQASSVERAPRGVQATLGGSPGQALLRYRDGRVTTAAGEPVEEVAASQRVMELPYTSDEVLMRLGPYDVIAVLGEGGMGVVYRAYAVRLGRWCALKVMRAGEQASAVDLVRFQNEAMLAARLSHPCIVPVFDAGEDGDIFYFVMELIAGRSLSALIEAPSPEGLEVGLRALVKVAEALHYAHERGIVHRDIKPDNILLTAEGEPRITDFGIAFNVTEVYDEVIQGRGLVGTPHYMSPEQANGEPGAVGALSDVYALGATLYELLTGRPPFEGKSLMEVLLKVTSLEPEPPRGVAAQRLQRQLSPDLETICLKALEKEAARRYPSAQAFAEDLQAYLEDRPISARPVGRAERLRKLLRRNRAVFAGAVIGVALLMLMAVGFGSVMIFNITLTNDSLRELDRQAALSQAGTLERAIRVNMLQGRADLARQLVTRLREDPELSRLTVVRTDRTIAYGDLATRERVARRLQDPEVVTWARQDFPELLPSIEEVQSKAFANIDRGAVADEPRFSAEDEATWGLITRSNQTVTLERRIDGEPTLVVLKPIENSPPCQVCHGRVGEEDYSGESANRVRAVVVIHRSRRGVEEQIHENQVTTAGIGLATTGVFGGLLLVLGRLFGIGLQPRRFGR